MSNNSVDENQSLLREAFDWLDRLQADDVTIDVYNDFQMWLSQDYRHEESYERAKTFTASFDYLNRDDIDTKHLQPLLVERLSHCLRKTISAFSSPVLKIGATVTAILLMGASTLYYSAISTGGSALTQANSIEHLTEKSEQRTIMLEDGTFVTLGASTSISISMTETSRRVTLFGGVALFDVTPDGDRPFSVKAGDLVATAKGTEFDVRSNGGVYRVAVAEGSVAVSFPIVRNGSQASIRERQLLVAGEQIAATGNGGLRSKTPISVQRVGAWRDAILFYDGATLEEMIADANRFSERKIVLEDGDAALLQRQISGSFRANDIAGLLSMISLSFDLRIDDSHTDRVILRSQTALPQ